MTAISIIIPIYNAEKYLLKCLDALANQTFKDIEILCIDDGSKDKSLRILKQYASQDSRFKVFTQTNSGPAAARNLGLKNASGKYLMFCDSDDWYEPNMCEQMYKTIISQNVDVVVCGCNIIDEEKNIRLQEDLSYYQLKYEKKQNITTDVFWNTNVLLWNKIFKTDIIRHYKMSFPTGYEHDDDCFYWQYMIVSQTAYFLQDKLYNYLRRNNSIMGKVYNKTNKSIYDQLYVLKYFYDYLQRNHIYQQHQKLFEELYVSGWNICTSFLDCKQYQVAYKIFQEQIQDFPIKTRQYLQQYCLPKHVLRIGNMNILELSKKKSFEKSGFYFDMRLILFSKINLFNISQKNKQIRIKLLGLRILKMNKNISGSHSSVQKSLILKTVELHYPCGRSTPRNRTHNKHKSKKTMVNLL